MFSSNIVQPIWKPITEELNRSLEIGAIINNTNATASTTFSTAIITQNKQQASTNANNNNPLNSGVGSTIATGVVSKNTVISREILKNQFQRNKEDRQKCTLELEHFLDENLEKFQLTSRTSSNSSNKTPNLFGSATEKVINNTVLVKEIPKMPNESENCDKNNRFTETIQMLDSETEEKQPLLTKNNDNKIITNDQTIQICNENNSLKKTEKETTKTTSPQRNNDKKIIQPLRRSVTTLMSTSHLTKPVQVSPKTIIDRTKVKEYMAEKQKKRRIEAASSLNTKDPKFNKEEIKKRLNELHKNSMKIVQKNIKKNEKRKSSNQLENVVKTIDVIVDHVPLKQPTTLVAKPIKQLEQIPKVLSDEPLNKTQNLSITTQPVYSTPLVLVDQTPRIKPPPSSIQPQSTARPKIGILRRASCDDQMFLSSTPIKSIEKRDLIDDIKPLEDSKHLITVPEEMELKIPDSFALKSSKLNNTTKLSNDSQLFRRHSPPKLDPPKPVVNIPYWLRPTLVQNYPYNFITAVRKKLESVTNPTPSINKTNKYSNNSTGDKHFFKTPLARPKKLQNNGSSATFRRNLHQEAINKEQQNHNHRKTDQLLSQIDSIPKLHSPNQSEPYTELTKSDSYTKNSSISVNLSATNKSIIKSPQKSTNFPNPMNKSSILSSTKLSTNNNEEHHAGGDSESQDTLSISWAIFSQSSPEKKTTEKILFVEPLSTQQIDGLKISRKNNNAQQYHHHQTTSEDDEILMIHQEPFKKPILSESIFLNTRRGTGESHSRPLKLNANSNKSLTNSLTSKSTTTTITESNIMDMLEEFNKSLSQVISVNEKLSSALNRQIETSKPMPKVNLEKHSTTSEDYETNEQNYSFNFENESITSQKSVKNLISNSNSDTNSIATEIPPYQQKNNEKHSSNNSSSSIKTDINDSNKKARHQLSNSTINTAASSTSTVFNTANEETKQQIVEVDQQSQDETIKESSMHIYQEHSTENSAIKSQNSIKKPIEGNAQLSFVKLLPPPPIQLPPPPPPIAPVPSSSTCCSTAPYAESDINQSTIGSDIFAVFNQTDLGYSIMSTTNHGSQTILSEGNVSYSSLGMYEQLIQTETRKSEDLSRLLKLREKALIDRAKGQIALLELQKKKYKEKGLTVQISMVRKKQRGLLMRLEREREEIHKTMKMQNHTTTKTTTTTNHHHQHQHQQRYNQNHTISMTNLLTTTVVGGGGDNEINNIPERLSSLRNNHQQRTLLVNDGILLSNTSRGQYDLDKSRGSLGSGLGAIRGYELTVGAGLESILAKREDELKRRREHVEHLIKWHQRLDQEESEVLQMERQLMALTVTKHRKTINAIDGGGGGGAGGSVSDNDNDNNQWQQNTSSRIEQKRQKKLREIEKSLSMLQNVSSGTNSKNNTNRSHNDNETSAEDFVNVSGVKMNKLWRRLTGECIEKFQPLQQYKLNKQQLEDLYEEAKSVVLMRFHPDNSKFDNFLNQSVNSNSVVMPSPPMVAAAPLSPSSPIGEKMPLVLENLEIITNETIKNNEQFNSIIPTVTNESILNDVKIAQQQFVVPELNLNFSPEPTEGINTGNKNELSELSSECEGAASDNGYYFSSDNKESEVMTNEDMDNKMKKIIIPSESLLENTSLIKFDSNNGSDNSYTEEQINNDDLITSQQSSRSISSSIAINEAIDEAISIQLDSSPVTTSVDDNYNGGDDDDDDDNYDAAVVVDTNKPPEEFQDNKYLSEEFEEITDKSSTTTINTTPQINEFNYHNSSSLIQLLSPSPQPPPPPQQPPPLPIESTSISTAENTSIPVDTLLEITTTTTQQKITENNIDDKQEKSFEQRLIDLDESLKDISEIMERSPVMELSPRSMSFKQQSQQKTTTSSSASIIENDISESLSSSSTSGTSPPQVSTKESTPNSSNEDDADIVADDENKENNNFTGNRQNHQNKLIQTNKTNILNNSSSVKVLPSSLVVSTARDYVNPSVNNVATTGNLVALSISVVDATPRSSDDDQNDETTATKTNSLKMPDIISEAEVLRRQQLQIEQEIKELEENVPYSIFLREIPNKPPPPYVPPAHGSPMTTIFPSDERIKETVYRRIEELYNIEQKKLISSSSSSPSPTPSSPPPSITPPQPPQFSELLDDKNIIITNIYERIILDICNEMSKELPFIEPKLTESSTASIEQIKFSHPLAFYNPPNRLQCIQEYALLRIKRLIGSTPFSTMVIGGTIGGVGVSGTGSGGGIVSVISGIRPLSSSSSQSSISSYCCNSRRKRRDVVDEILVQEMFDDSDESWTNFDVERVEVLNSVSKDIMNILCDEAINDFKYAENEKQQRLQQQNCDKNK